jgi:hypothetical protein
MSSAAVALAGGSAESSAGYGPDDFVMLKEAKKNVEYRKFPCASAASAASMLLAAISHLGLRKPAPGTSLLLVAEGGVAAPSHSDLIDAARTPLPDSAVITPGSWLAVLFPEQIVQFAPPQGSGEGSQSPASSVSTKSVGAMQKMHTGAREVEASVVFLALAHAAFPSAALETVKAGLLGGTLPIANRTFHLSDTDPATATAFLAGRTAFYQATLDVVWPPQPAVGSGVPRINLGGDYLKLDYASLEIDCLLKVPALTDYSWTRDPAAKAGPFFIAPAALSALPVREDPTALALQVHGPTPSHSSRFSQDHYHPNAAMYIMGEVYAPLGTEDETAKPVQKLLQAERNLRFLEAKEGRAVGDCVLGVVFMGPAMGTELVARLFLALQHYASILPCLWCLYNLKRVLGCCVEVHHSAVHAALSTSALERIEHAQKQQQQQQLLQQQHQVQQQAQLELLQVQQGQILVQQQEQQVQMTKLFDQQAQLNQILVQQQAQVTRLLDQQELFLQGNQQELFLQGNKSCVVI